MGEFDDFVQGDGENKHVTNKTLDVTLRFYDPDTPATYVEIAFTAIHATRQFGESPSINEIYENDAESYIGVVGFPCYVYFYNDNASNVITVSAV